MTAVAIAPRSFPAAAEASNGGDQTSPFPSSRRRKIVVDQATGKQRVTVTREKDNGEYFAMMYRLVRAAAKRVKAEDPSTLAQFGAVRRAIDDAMDDCAKDLHRQGWSWGEIGYEFGIGRHAARKRWGTDR